MYHNNKYAMDYVIKLENFEQDVIYVMNKLKIKHYTLYRFDQKVGLHSLNNQHYTKFSIEKQKEKYQPYYSKTSKDFISTMFAEDIKRFNYTF